MKNITDIKKDKYLGCLVGGAVGDALGYPVEFYKESDIKDKFGDGGITEYAPNCSKALFSDDTQMTLFTANGILNSITEENGRFDLNKTVKNIGSCYIDWLLTQIEDYPIPDTIHNSWLIKIPDLFACRAPGFTCISALKRRVCGVEASIAAPINDSKGCGGVMRVAPIGLFNLKKSLTIEETDMLAAEVAAITHNNDLGYIPAAALAHVVRRTAQENMPLDKAVNDMISTVSKLFSESEQISVFTSLMKKAVSLAKSTTPDIDAIHQLGEGWIGDEAFAIAVFCSLRYSNDIEKALIVSVNHNGDSDSTGAITGNILGACLGLSAIPEKFIKDLELLDVITELAEDLYQPEVGSEAWISKYVNKTYTPRT